MSTAKARLLIWLTNSYKANGQLAFLSADHFLIGNGLRSQDMIIRNDPNSTGVRVGQVRQTTVDDLFLDGLVEYEGDSHRIVISQKGRNAVSQMTVR